MALPRKFLNEDEELLAELRPHWIFLFGPLFTSIGVWAAIIVLVILWRNPPGWTNYPFLIIALIPGLWLLGRFVRWRSYDVALTSTRILVRQGILGRDTVQLRLQRITEVNIRQDADRADPRHGQPRHRRAGRGRLADARVHAQAGRRAARHQLADQRDRRRRAPRADPARHAALRRARRSAAPQPRRRRRTTTQHDTPPFGVRASPAATSRPRSGARAATRGRAGGRPGAAPFEIRDRLIELDDLRQRGILSEEEFAAKKSELLNRI